MLRSAASRVVRERLAGLSINALKQRAAAANAELYNLGITFTIYSDAQTIDRILPFDVLPRILSAEEWLHIESGIVQRITAINLLLDDVYHDQHVLRDGVVPADRIIGNRNYRPLMRGIDLPHADRMPESRRWVIRLKGCQASDGRQRLLPILRRVVRLVLRCACIDLGSCEPSPRLADSADRRRVGHFVGRTERLIGTAFMTEPSIS